MTLLEKAQSAPRGDRRNYDTIIDAVECLRRKGWTFRAIHQWLQEEGVHVHENYVTFASAMSQRIKHRRNKNQ